MGKVLRFERRFKLAKAVVIRKDDVPTLDIGETYEEKQERMARERRANNARVFKSYRMKHWGDYG